MVAYTYPLLDIFWTMLWFFAFFVWIWLLVVVFTDIFRSHDMGGFAKALWFLFVLFIPLLGVLVYLIARVGRCTTHAARDAQSEQEAFDAHVRERAAHSGSSTADQLARLAGLEETARHHRGGVRGGESQGPRLNLRGVPGARPRRTDSTPSGTDRPPTT